MLPLLLICSLLNLVAVKSFRITSMVDSDDSISSSLHSNQRSLDPPYPDHTVYEAIFAGVKKPISVDCTQPGIICKFPLVVVDKELSAKPAKNIKPVPIIKGVEASSNDDAEEKAREDFDDKEDMIESLTMDKVDGKVPVFQGTLDVESVFSNSKDVGDLWILEKDILNKKYQIPVKLAPSSPHRDHGVAPMYPVHHDFHDHFTGGDAHHFPSSTHGSGWTPWTRAYPSVYHYPSNQPCQPPPVYHHPPPCNPSVAPTKKPVINIDDKVDKEK